MRVKKDKFINTISSAVKTYEEIRQEQKRKIEEMIKSAGLEDAF